jgi:oxalate---CoA ligase
MKIALDSIGSITDHSSGDVWPARLLAEEVRVRAARLSGLGLTSSHRVLILYGGTPGFFADLLAIWRVGACVACANPNLTSFELNQLIEFLRPQLVIVDESGSAKAAGAGIAVVSLSDSSAKLGVSTGEHSNGLDGDALILFTSGSTGQPKGVVHSFRSIFTRLALNHAWIPRNERSVSLCMLPTHFGHGLIGNALTPLLDGGDLVLSRAGDLRTALSLGETIDLYGVTFMSSVPSFWKIVLKGAERPRKQSMRRVHIGSAPLTARLWSEVIEWAGTRNVCNMYGATEAANWIAGASALDIDPIDGFVGQVWGGRGAILSADGEICSVGRGEILVHTPSVMRGYLGSPALTGAVLDSGWLHTGDLGEIDPAGNILLTGRLKTEINRAGQKVSPEEIDLLLEQHDGVREACAFGISDEITGEMVAVAIVPQCPADFNLSKLKAWCGERLLREKIPERWFVLSEIPKTHRGKIDRLAVTKICADLIPERSSERRIDP